MRSVLVVDDDAAFRALASRLLRSWGHTIVGQAETVAQALALAEELRPDAVLVDVGLPDGDGGDLARRLVALSWRPSVVLVSSDPVAAAHARDVAPFLAKDELPELRARGWLDGG
jgi:CheY-like chemotaxis protein